MDFDPARLRRGELLAGAGAVLLTVFMFAGKWYGHGSQARTGWQALPVIRWLLVVTIVLAFALVLTQLTRRSPAIPVTLSLFVFVFGVISVIALIYRVLINPPAHEQIGAFLGLISAAGLAYGGYLSLREEGVSARDAPGEIPVVRPGSENPGREPRS
jgi:prepilin signal peptidase PulO-like enzyme (type II secretory pathway)